MLPATGKWVESQAPLRCSTLAEVNPAHLNSNQLGLVSISVYEMGRMKEAFGRQQVWSKGGLSRVLNEVFRVC